MNAWIAGSHHCPSLQMLLVHFNGFRHWDRSDGKILGSAIGAMLSTSKMLGMKTVAPARLGASVLERRRDVF